MPPLKTAVFLLALVVPASGQMVRRWTKLYNGPGNLDDGASAVAVDSAGNVIVTGDSPTAESNMDFYTVKYAAADGAVLWDKRATPSPSDDATAGLAVDSSGNVAVTGYSGPAAAQRYYTIKYAAENGRMLWEQFHDGGPGYYRFSSAVAADSAGDVIVTGSVGYDFDILDFYTIKLFADEGSMVWEKRYNGPRGKVDVPLAIAVDGTDNVIVAGRSTGNGSADFDCYTVKYAVEDGAVLWQHRHNGSGDSNDEIRALVIDNDGDVVVVGKSRGGSGSKDNFYRAKYASADGATLWEHFDGGPDDETATAVALDSSGNVILSGFSGPAASGDGMSYITMKLAAANGATIWSKSRKGPPDTVATGNGVAVAPNGNVFAAGTSLFTGNSLDIYAVQYAAADGALLWEDRFQGPANAIDSVGPGKAVAATPDGGFVVTGFTKAASFDFLTISYAPAPTALEVWRQLYFDTPDNAGDAADGADPDHDTVLNLIEWACGTNPTTVSPVPGTPGREGAVFNFLYTRTIAAGNAGAVFAVEWSATMAAGDWHTDGVTETIVSSDSTTQQVRASLPADSAARFFRLRVNAPP